MAYPIALRISISDAACAVIRHQIYKVTDDPLTARKLNIRYTRGETWQQFKDRMQEPWDWLGAAHFAGIELHTAKRVRVLARKIKMPELARIADAHEAMWSDWQKRRGTENEFIKEYHNDVISRSNTQVA